MSDEDAEEEDEEVGCGWVDEPGMIACSAWLSRSGLGWSGLN